MCEKKKECSFKSSCECNNSSVNKENDEKELHYEPVDEEKRSPGVTGYDIDDLVHD